MNTLNHKVVTFFHSQAKRAISLPKEIESGRLTLSAGAAVQTIVEEADLENRETSSKPAASGKTDAVIASTDTRVASPQKLVSENAVNGQRRSSSALDSGNHASKSRLKVPDKGYRFVPDGVIGQAWQAPLTANNIPKRLRSVSAKETSLGFGEAKVRYAPVSNPGGLASLLSQSPKLQDRKVLEYATTSLNLARQKMWSMSDSRSKHFFLPPANKSNNLVVQSTNPYLVDSSDLSLQWPITSRGKTPISYPHLPPAMPQLFKVKKEKAIIKGRAPMGIRSPPCLSTIARGYSLERRDGSAKLDKNPSPNPFESSR